MSITAILLLVISAGLHAGWNVLGKRTRSRAATYLVASAVGTIILSPFPLSSPEIVDGFTGRVWIYVAGTGVFMALYYASLAAGYRSGDMSLVYPVARATPAILVALISVLLGRGQNIAGLAILGMFCIVVGAYVLPMTHRRDFSIRNYLTTAYLMALLAAIGTAGYSTLDDSALSVLRASAGTNVASWRVAGVYAFFESLSAVVWLLLLLLCSKRERSGFVTELAGANLRTGVFMGVGIHITYTIVLVSMAFVSDVSYVVAFRQLSIPLGVVLGVVLLREKLYAPKLVGALLMFGGVVIVALG